MEEPVIKSPKYGPNKDIAFNKELFIAEYSSLRSEILQRISQQTTLYQIAITAFGLIIGYALEKVDPNNWYNSIILICVYPLLTLLLSYAWSFNQIRICQIVQYIRSREEELVKADIGLIWWENYVAKEPPITRNGKQFFPRHIKNTPGSMILAGTQFASIIIAFILLFVHLLNKPDSSNEVTQGKMGYMMEFLVIIFLLIDLFTTWVTFTLIKRSGGS